jgi:hypothetical protein
MVLDFPKNGVAKILDPIEAQKVTESKKNMQKIGKPVI